MNKYIYLIIVLFWSCKHTINKPEEVKVIINEDGVEIKEDTIGNIVVENDDCIFDQATQTDDFLKGIKELEGYRWIQETKTAEIVLNDHWNLTIHRGGCDHFEMSATFIYDRVLDIEKDKKQIFDNIIWITSILDEFEGKDIRRIIEEDNVSITKSDEFNYHANFMDVKLYELYYFDFNNKDVTTFSISYYYN